MNSLKVRRFLRVSSLYILLLLCMCLGICISIYIPKYLFLIVIPILIFRFVTPFLIKKINSATNHESISKEDIIERKKIANWLFLIIVLSTLAFQLIKHFK